MAPRGTLVIFTALALFHVQVCIAQERSPKDFYENNYAQSTGDLGTRGAQPVAGAKQSAKKVTRPSGALSAGTKSREADPGKANSKTKKRRVIVSVIVNSLDKAHFAKVVGEVFRLSDTNSVFVSEVLHIGDYTTVTDDVENECAKRGIFIHQIDSPPKGLSVTTSPAWRVQTRDGFYLVEGLLSIDRFIDGWGEFDPKSYRGVEGDLRIDGF